MSNIREKRVSLLEIIFPGDTNYLGTAFGGHILSLMDKAAVFAAVRHSHTPAVVTVSIDRVDFTVPIEAGDFVELIAYVTSVGRTSMRVQVDVFKENRQTHEQILATSGLFVMVAIDDNRKPTRVPPLDE